MALGTITVGTIRERGNGGKLIPISFPGDSSYPTGGTATFTALVEAAIKTAMAALGDANVRGPLDLTIVALIPGNCGQYLPSFDAVNDKLFVRDAGHATLDEVTAAVNLSGTTFNVVLIAD